MAIEPTTLLCMLISMKVLYNSEYGRTLLITYNELVGLLLLPTHIVHVLNAVCILCIICTGQQTVATQTMYYVLLLLLDSLRVVFVIYCVFCSLYCNVLSTAVSRSIRWVSMFGPQAAKLVTSWMPNCHPSSAILVNQNGRCTALTDETRP